MFSRTIFRYTASRLISNYSRSSLSIIRQPLGYLALRSVRGYSNLQRFRPGDWQCRICGAHNFEKIILCKCGCPKSPLAIVEGGCLPTSTGPYSHAMKTPHGIYVSGQLPADLDGNMVKGTMREKTNAVFKNLELVLMAAGSSLDKIVKVQVFLTDMSDLGEMNEEYSKWLKHKPARSCVAVKELPKGAAIEIDCIATF